MIPMISTVIPFCNRDAHLVSDAITSILNQTLPSIIYVVGDNVDYKIMDQLAHLFKNKSHIHFFKTDETIGPYSITNSIIKHHLCQETLYLAIQDADDISYPHRFETQVIDMKNIIDHSSGPMKHSALPGYKGDRHLKEPTLLCGPKAHNVPLGRFINGTRMVSIKLFRKLNGFPPIFCSGDICFDNTIQHLGILTAVSTRVLAERRLHPDSLTNHPDTSRTGAVRQTCMYYLYAALAAIKADPSIQTAFKYGGLEDAERLEELC